MSTQSAINVVPAQRALTQTAKVKARQNGSSPRGGRPQPDRDPAFASHPLESLRAMRSGLSDEECRVSYWRRIVQARLDLLQRPHRRGRLEVAQLTSVLADSNVSHRRVAALTIEPVDDLPRMPDIAELWSREVDEQDEAGQRELVEQLKLAEADLSAYRRELHSRIDRVTQELIVRYREDPVLALTALRERLPAAFM
ncbi:MAG: hypothetical protein U0904_03460 [Candidatus Nanopelagicales bacterium]|nr:hypothetical protein [Candidatus Nanopelagicales bacterium]